MVRLNLNPLFKPGGLTDWNIYDKYDDLYNHNLDVLRKRIKSLKILSWYSHYSSDKSDYHIKISCAKEEEEYLVKVLQHLKDCGFVKI